MIETILYSESNGKFIGHCVNLPMCIVQSNSLEDMKDKMKKLVEFHITKLQEMIKQNEPFKFVLDNGNYQV